VRKRLADGHGVVTGSSLLDKSPFPVGWAVLRLPPYSVPWRHPGPRPDCSV